MKIRINQASPVPPFEQVRGQISLMVAAGQLRPGDRLPTIRALARELNISNGTVARAYRELDYAGIVSSKGRGGTVVADEPPVAFEVTERRERLEAAAAAFVHEARQLGVGPTDSLEAIAAAFRHVDQHDVTTSEIDPVTGPMAN